MHLVAGYGADHVPKYGCIAHFLNADQIRIQCFNDPGHGVDRGGAVLRETLDVPGQDIQGGICTECDIA
ncbi:MAG: Uncharacterised protein [Flavobacteriia bacterium]|nr:MAG: Uncharacterised protein [Flavobacteriia bacterium]